MTDQQKPTVSTWEGHLVRVEILYRGRWYDMPTWRRTHPTPTRYGPAYRHRQLARRRRNRR